MLQQLRSWWSIAVLLSPRLSKGENCESYITLYNCSGLPTSWRKTPVYSDVWWFLGLRPQIPVNSTGDLVPKLCLELPMNLRPRLGSSSWCPVVHYRLLNNAMTAKVWVPEDVKLHKRCAAVHLRLLNFWQEMRTEIHPEPWLSYVYVFFKGGIPKSPWLFQYSNGHPWLAWCKMTQENSI